MPPVAPEAHRRKASSEQLFPGPGDGTQDLRLLQVWHAATHGGREDDIKRLLCSHSPSGCGPPMLASTNSPILNNNHLLLVTERIGGGIDLVGAPALWPRADGTCQPACGALPRLGIQWEMKKTGLTEEGS